MYVYHGSEKIIQTPFLDFGFKYNDFGQGFYCVTDSEFAKEWACQNKTCGFINAYEINLEYFNILDLTTSEYHILNWLALVLNNKHIEDRNKDIVKIKKYIIKEFLPDLNNVDAIKGYRADNSYFAIIRAFLSGEISLRKFFALVQDNYLCQQLVLVSDETINMLDFKYAENVDYINYYYNIITRDLQIQSQLNDKTDNDYIYVKDIIKDKWINDDERLQRMLH